jgi:hypothetical protein
LTNAYEDSTINSVRKLIIFLLSISLVSVIAVLSSNFAFASTLSIPPTTEGPGIVLPNSPLFFMDKIKQEFRLLLAFTPEQKARIHNSVAGERMAELRVMLAKDNAPGIEIALQGISDNFKKAAEDLADAKLTGRDINILTKEINNSIKEKQKVLSSLEKQATGEVRAQVVAAKEGLKVAKTQVEENLPVDQLVNETIGDLNQQIADDISSVSFSAAEINRAIAVLTSLASESAVQKQPEIKDAIGELQKASKVLQ